MRSSVLKGIAMLLLGLSLFGVTLVLGLVSVVLTFVTVSKEFRLAPNFDMLLLISSELVGTILAFLASIVCVGVGYRLLREKTPPPSADPPAAP